MGEVACQLMICQKEHVAGLRDSFDRLGPVNAYPPSLSDLHPPSCLTMLKSAHPTPD